MTWLKTDDKFPEHRKIRRLSHGAFRLHVTAMCYAAHDETDGRLDASDVDEMQHGKSLARYIAELVASGLWETTETGYQIHDFLDWNPSHVQLEAERAAARKRQASARARRRGVANPENPQVDDGSHGVTNAVTNGDVTRESQAPVPYRSVPFRTVPTKDISSEVADATLRPVDATPPRPDVEALLAHLDEQIARNGSRTPARTKRNVDAARLLLDRDGHTVPQILAAIDFATSDEFWRSNILSMSKLREQYDRLRLAAQRQNYAPRTTSTTNQRVSDVLALAADLRAKEDAEKAAVAQIGASA